MVQQTLDPARTVPPNGVPCLIPLRYMTPVSRDNAIKLIQNTHTPIEHVATVPQQAVFLLSGDGSDHRKDPITKRYIKESECSSLTTVMNIAHNQIRE